jgi:uncharacterized membrane protein
MTGWCVFITMGQNLMNDLLRVHTKGENKMITVEQSVMIDLPVEKVFEIYADARNHIQWDSTIIECTHTPEGPVGVGITVIEKRKLLGRIIENSREMVAYEPNAKIWYKAEVPFPGDGGIIFEGDGDGTKLTQRMNWDVGGFFSLAEPLVAVGMRRALKNTLKDFKVLIESGNVTMVTP